MKKLYVGNLPFNTQESEVRDMFSEYGSVDDVKIITDRETGRSRGFAFVQMGNDSEADAAMEGLNGKDMNGRALVVNEAREREPRSGGGGGGGGGGRRDRW